MKTDEYGNEIIGSSGGGGNSPAPSQPSSGGGLLSAFNPLSANTKLASTMYQGAASAGQDKSAKGNLGKSLSNAMGNIGNVATQLPGAAFEDLLNGLGLKGAGVAAKGGATVGKGIGMVAKYPTKKILSDATDKVAAEGNSLPWDQVKNTIANNVFNGKSGTGGLLKTQANRQALKNIFSALEKNGIDNNSISALNQLKGRRQIAATLPQNFLSQMFNGGKAANQVGGVVRNSLSDLVHQSAPGTVPLDKLYRLYGKVGDVPSVAKHAVAAYAGDRLGKAVGGPVGETGADVLSFLKYIH